MTETFLPQKGAALFPAFKEATEIAKKKVSIQFVIKHRLLRFLWTIYQLINMLSKWNDMRPETIISDVTVFCMFLKK